MSGTQTQRTVDVLCVVLLAAAFATIQVLIGGTRLVFSLPAYALVAVAGMLSVFAWKRARPSPDTFCLVGSALFFGYVIGRALLSPVPYVARTDLFIVLGSLLVYGLTVTLFTEAKSRLVFICFLLLCGMVHVGIGAIQFRDANDFMLIPFLQRADYGRRASGFYVCPNHLAGMLEVIAVFGVSIVCWSRFAVWVKLFVGYAVAVSYAGVALTGSRGGYLSVGASLIVFAVLSVFVVRASGGGLPRKIAVVSVAFLLFASVVAFVSIRHSNFLTERAGNIADVSNIRLDLWHAAIEQWKQAPVFGTGSATYRYFGRKFRTPTMQMDPLETHNDYLQLLCEYGVVGVVAFVAFLAFHVRAGWRAFRRLGDKRAAVASRLLSNSLALNLGALAAVAAYIVHSAFDFNLHIPANAMLLAFVFGVLANPGVWRSGELQRNTRGTWLARVSVTALAAIVLMLSARFLPAEYFAEKARVALRRDQPGAVILAANESLTHDRKNPDVYSYLGRARLGMGFDMRDARARDSFYLAAVEAFESARTLAPLEETYPLTLGLLYDLLGRYPEGEWMLDLARTLDPNGAAVSQYYEEHLSRWRRSGTVPAETLSASPSSASLK